MLDLRFQSDSKQYLSVSHLVSLCLGRHSVLALVKFAMYPAIRLLLERTLLIWKTAQVTLLTTVTLFLLLSVCNATCHLDHVLRKLTRVIEDSKSLGASSAP